MPDQPAITDQAIEAYIAASDKAYNARTRARNPKEEIRAGLAAAAPHITAQTVRDYLAVRTGLDHAIGHLAVNHRHRGLHDTAGGSGRCEGCGVLGDLEDVQKLAQAAGPGSATPTRTEAGRG